MLLKNIKKTSGYYLFCYTYTENLLYDLLRWYPAMQICTILRVCGCYDPALNLQYGHILLSLKYDDIFQFFHTQMLLDVIFLS